MTGKKKVLVILLCVCLALLGVYSISISSRTSTNEQDFDIAFDVDTIISNTDTVLYGYNKYIVEISFMDHNTLESEDSISGFISDVVLENIRKKFSPIIEKNGLVLTREGYKIFNIVFRVTKEGEILHPTLYVSREHYNEFSLEKYHEILVYIQKISLADIYKYDCDNILTIPVYRHSTINLL